VLSRNLNQALYAIWPYDGKTQVTLQGEEIVSIVASFQHAPASELEDAVKQWARTQQYVSSCFVKGRNDNPELHINPAGDWSVGGFDADAGLTGRKLVVDNYGPRIPIGGGAFSGKDPSKVDRSAAYMARKIAVDYLARFQANEVYVYLAYAIGYDQPLEATVVVDGQEKIAEGYDLSPNGIIRALDLKRPQYEVTAEYGHFGHAGFAWEK
jgi:S-adenosylmethionine synthetase